MQRRRASCLAKLEAQQLQQPGLQQLATETDGEEFSLVYEAILDWEIDWYGDQDHSLGCYHCGPAPDDAHCPCEIGHEKPLLGKSDSQTLGLEGCNRCWKLRQGHGLCLSLKVLRLKESGINIDSLHPSAILSSAQSLCSQGLHCLQCRGSTRLRPLPDIFNNDSVRKLVRQGSDLIWPQYGRLLGLWYSSQVFLDQGYEGGLLQPPACQTLLPDTSDLSCASAWPSTEWL